MTVRKSTRSKVKPETYKVGPIKLTVICPGTEQDNKPNSTGESSATIQRKRFLLHDGMTWVDDEHIVRPGAEMRRTAPTVQELLGTWRWAYRTGMASDKGFAYHDVVGRMCFNHRGLSPCAPECIIKGAVKKSNAVKIIIDMTDDPQKQHHANVQRRQDHQHTALHAVTGPLQRGRNRVELFAFKKIEHDTSDVPRGYQPPVTRAYDLYVEMYSKFGREEVSKGPFHLGIGVSKRGTQWHRWLGWKGVQKGWYQNS
ncbi:MAG: hypothetical protein FRX48_09315 [Lasallia pustulata]|uniref:Uncharacterized protein n=1 Tax=Lasallia pustulata TaxID=136370 RepID=A0A5M8PBZ8_9LECA|nr:MAG: hypothetical protein FRX48_09315 [Lasallia pustulata]